MPLPATAPVSAVPALAGASALDAFPEREVALPCETGLLAAPLAPAFGGGGLDHGVELAAVLKAVGRGSLALGRQWACRRSASSRTGMATIVRGFRSLKECIDRLSEGDGR
jgi:hypothetical protein